MGFFDFLKRKELDEIKRLTTQLERYKSISDIELEVERQQRSLNERISKKEAEFNALIRTKLSETKRLEDQLSLLNTNYQESLGTYTKLRNEVSIFESKLDLIEFGMYEPIYDFEKSDDYRIEQNRIIAQQKAMISTDAAAICTTNWRVGESERDGRAVVNRYKKLMLRAFNGECDVLIAKVKWNNANQMKERMVKLFDAINKLGEGFKIYLSSSYLDLKKRELALEYEYQAKKQQEKEELRAAQEELREDEKARREFEQAQKNAEKEELTYQKALEKARKEVDSATGEKQRKLLEQIAKLEQALEEAQAQKERALSMAQQTKRGHVYVISNIGSFGENVYKIGMTRRLEPEDRVKELGDASVPFHFDIHAMIYSDEAPRLENELHRVFADRKVNMLNYRKEFFNVSLQEIETKVKEMGIRAEFVKIPAAVQYRETLAILAKLNSDLEQKPVASHSTSEFPANLRSR
jgi:hypothetical protein